MPEAKSRVSTKELDIRDDLNSVKNDLLNIKNDLTSTVAGVSKDFESIRKDVTLKNNEGETMGAQREQYTYKVTDATTSDGSDAVRVEETITRETIIQDAIEDAPATATETITDLSSGEATPTLDGTIEVPALQSQALRTILPARPMDAPVAEAASGDLTATETVTVMTEETEPVKSNAGVPILEIEPSRAANPFAVAYDMPEPAPVEFVPEPEYAMAGGGVPLLRNGPKAWKRPGKNLTNGWKKWKASLWNALTGLKNSWQASFYAPTRIKESIILWRVLTPSANLPA